MNFLGKKMKRNRIIISLLVLILSLCISACLNQQASTQKIPIKGSATLFSMVAAHLTMRKNIW